LDRFESVTVWHQNIEDHQIRGYLIEKGQTLSDAGRIADVVAGSLERLLNEHADGFLVVDNEYVCHGEVSSWSVTWLHSNCYAINQEKASTPTLHISSIRYLLE